MITLKKVSELKIHGYIYTDSYSPRLISLDNSNESCFIIDNEKNTVLEYCQIEYLDKNQLEDCYHNNHYDKYLPCIMASHNEIIPLYEVMRF
jgi:hypothetical protein